MESSGIMEQVRGLLSQGLNSSEIIAQGYAASTVYGVQRKLRKQQGLLGNSFHTGPNSEGYLSRMASENRWLRRRVEALEDRGSQDIRVGATTFPTTTACPSGGTGAGLG